MLFWIHHASGPIALGILTIAAIGAAIGYLQPRSLGGVWSRSRWRQRRQARKQRVINGRSQAGMARRRSMARNACAAAHSS